METERKLPLKTLREQEVQIALESVAARNGGCVPTRAEVQKEMKRLKFKHLSLNRISEIIGDLEQKGYVRYRLEVVA